MLAAAALSLLLGSPALAGDLLVEAAVPADLQLGNTLLTRTWGDTRLRVAELEPGLAQVRVVRGERTDLIDVLIPDEGAARLTITADSLSTEPVEDDPAWPVLELRASTGQRFGVVLDGHRLGVVGHRYPVRVEGIASGSHHLELRTEDLTVIWARGDLDLAEDDLLIVTGIEGYAPLVSGREGAFRLAGDATRKPTEGDAGSGG